MLCSGPELPRVFAGDYALLRIRVVVWMGEERRAAADGLVGEVECVVLGEEVRGPARAGIGSVEPVRAGLSKASPEDDGVRVAGGDRRELFDIDLLGEDGTVAIIWLRWLEQ